MISKPNQLEFRQLRYFLVLAETLHFGKAAEKLFLSQSALSQQIKQLESFMGTRLIDRTNRKVALNRAGRLFLREAQIIVRQLEKSSERWQSEYMGIRGEIKIGFVGSAMQQYLPPILKQFVTNHPTIKLQLEELRNKEQLEALEHAVIDIGFMRSNQISPEMNIKSVFQENFTLVLPKQHALTAGNFKNIGQLSEESFILFPNEKSPMYYQQILNMCAASGFSPKISHRSIHGPTIFKLVENGMGISIVPNSLRDERNAAIRFIELNNIPYQTELFAAWRKGNDNPSLYDFLKIV